MTLVLQLVSCASMTGVIWFVQLIAYPAFRYIDRERFADFHSLHSNRITMIVGPTMLVELGTAIGLAMLAPKEYLPWVNLALVLILWLWTGLVSVPIHNRLTKGYDSAQIEKLIQTNWPRTIIWTARFLFLTFYHA